MQDKHSTSELCCQTRDTVTLCILCQNGFFIYFKESSHLFGNRKCRTLISPLLNFQKLPKFLRIWCRDFLGSQDILFGISKISYPGKTREKKKLFHLIASLIWISCLGFVADAKHSQKTWKVRDNRGGCSVWLTNAKQSFFIDILFKEFAEVQLRVVEWNGKQKSL